MISKKRLWVTCLASAVLAALLGGGLSLYWASRATPLGKVWSIVNLIDKTFYEPVDREEAFEGAFQGAVSSLGDPYSVYMNADEWKEYLIRTSGEYTGIGITIDVREDLVRIAEPMIGTPAEKAGLKANDVILKVDGEPVKNSDDVASKIRGPADTPVTLVILRENETFETTIVRKPIMVPAVSSQLLENHIGLIQLMSFNEHSYSETKSALDTLRAQGAEAMILDMRYNGGGFVDQCLGIAELFVPKGTVVSLRYKDRPEQVSSSSGEGLEMPLVVLVNGGTASASEILGGAIQDRRAGTLVGTQTFGKGLVQSIFYLPDQSVVKITTAEYLTPNGRKIHGEGLTPDVSIQGDDEQMAKAVQLLKESLAGSQ